MTWTRLRTSHTQCWYPPLLVDRPGHEARPAARIQCSLERKVRSGLGLLASLRHPRRLMAAMVVAARGRGLVRSGLLSLGTRRRRGYDWLVMAVRRPCDQGGARTTVLGCFVGCVHCWCRSGLCGAFWCVVICEIVNMRWPGRMVECSFQACWLRR